MRTNIQNGEVRAGGQISVARQRRRKQETAKEIAVSELETGRYLRIHGGADTAAKLKGRDDVPHGGKAIEIDAPA